MPLSFLLIGIAWDQMERLVGPDRAPAITTQVKAALARGEEEFRQAGLNYRLINFGPEESMDRLEGVLREKKWDGVCV